MIADVVNGLFEGFGAVALYGNVRRIRADKQVKGIDWRSTTFFTLWGLWNLYYYPSLDQWFSTAGGAAICSMNIAWLFYALKYRSNV